MYAILRAQIDVYIQSVNNVFTVYVCS